MQALSFSAGATAVQGQVAGHPGNGKGQHAGGGQTFAALLAAAGAPPQSVAGVGKEGLPAAAARAGGEVPVPLPAQASLEPDVSGAVVVTEETGGMTGQDPASAAPADSVAGSVQQVPPARPADVAYMVPQLPAAEAVNDADDAAEGQATAAAGDIAKGKGRVAILSATPVVRAAERPVDVSAARLLSASDGEVAAVGAEPMQASRSASAAIPAGLALRDAPEQPMQQTAVLPAPEAGSRIAAAGGSVSVQATHSRVSAPAIHAQIAEGVSKAGASDGGRVTVQLNPQELGRVEVTLIKGDGHHSARVVVDRAETLDAVRSEIRQLERALAEAGMDVRTGSVSVTLRGSGADAGGLQDRAAGGEGERDVHATFVEEEPVRAEARPRRFADGRGSRLNISV